MKTFLKKIYSDVAEFNKKIFWANPQEQMTALDGDIKLHAVTALREEVEEFNKAEDLEGQVDAIIDLLYFALGRLYLMGVPIEACWDEIQRSNMSKERKIGVRGKAKESAFKGKTYSPPDLSFLGNLSPAFLTAARLRAKKQKDYSDIKGYFPFGDKSYVQMIYVKTRRLIALTSSNNQPANESIKDSVLDLLNYASYYYEYLEEVPEHKIEGTFAHFNRYIAGDR